MITIEHKKDCCGCGACANICPKRCISMEEDAEGFLYPSVTKSACVQCGLCEKVCPIQTSHQRQKNPDQKAAIVQHLDSVICSQSTAGGAFTAIAEYVISAGGVVFGVEMRPDYTVRHTVAERKEELVKFRNSKYVQSDISNTYQQVKAQLESKKLVCFSGTPCQIEGLRCYLGKEYENLILVDVVCRAVPSPGVWKKYISFEQRRHGKIQSVRFRDKTLGYQYSTMELKTTDGKVDRGGIESQPWLRMFFSGMIIRPSCTACRFRDRNRNSDFTIWDCFNVHNIDKSFNEDAGVTRMLIHTDKGNKIFAKIRDQFIWREIPVSIAVDGVREMVDSPQVHSDREAFFRDFHDLEMEKLLNKYFPQTLKVRLKKRVRLFLNLLGLDKTLKHILKKG